jgi:hypothetical protein
MEIIKRKTLQDIAVSEQILDIINPKELFNYFIDTPARLKVKDPYQEFVQLCRTNLGFAARTIIGNGDFELLPFQAVILETLWDKTFPLLLMTRGGGKTTMLAIYAILRAILDQSSSRGSKIVVTAASFRQSKEVMRNIDALYRRSPLLQECSTFLGGLKKNNDKWEFQFGNSTITALPLGDGQKIRGIRATSILCDEFGSVPEEVFNVVVRGFAAVSANPVEAVRRKYRRNKMLARGLKKEFIPDGNMFENQIIRSGTATYEFNHFYQIYSRYKKIIINKIIGNSNDKDVQKILGSDMLENAKLDYRKLAIIEMPYMAIPVGYMDDTMINESKISMTQDQFDMEYNAKFIVDSKGFFKASAIDGATPRTTSPNYFHIELDGNHQFDYVMGVDPARWSDDFAIVILKVLKHSHRIVYMKKWNQKNFGVIANTMRDLVKKFNIKRIGIDKGGGGAAIMDFLQTPEMIPAGDLPYWEVDDKTNAGGLKLLEMVNYMGKWLIDANYALCADIEHKRLLFPYNIDEMKYDQENRKKASDIMDLVLECKKQLVQIEITATAKSEIEHFDLPPELKWKRKKDLYSALLLAADQARKLKIGEARMPSWDNEAIGGSVTEYIR